MTKIESYKDLIVWQKAMRLSQDVEDLASRLPAHHKFGLASQLRRASNSVPFNVAEGQQRTTRVYINHLMIALGSEAELQTQLERVAKMRLAPQAETDDLVERTREIGRMLRGLVSSLRRHIDQRS